MVGSSDTPRPSISKVGEGVKACDPNLSVSAKRETGVPPKHVSPSADVETLVPPWLLLALVLVLAYIFFTRLGNSPKEAVARPEATENSSVLLIALPIVAGYGLVIIAALVLPGLLGPEATMWALLAALVLMMTRRCSWTAIISDIALLAFTSLSSTSFALVAVVCFLFYPLIPSASVVGFTRKTEASTSKRIPLHRRLRLDIFRSSCEQQQPSEAKLCGAEGSRVLLHVYDITHNSKIRCLNSLLSERHPLLKVGGLFHVGVEVYGREWCFGYCDAGSGVTGITPKNNKLHHYRETISLQQTDLSEEQFLGIIRSLQVEYKGAEYCLLRRNCCHFADDLCSRLGVGGLPLWVHRLARTVAWVQERINSISELFDKLGHLSQCVKIAPQL